MSDPVLLEINQVKIYNPDIDEEDELKKIDFEGTDIWEHPDIEERRNDGWVIRGLEAVVQYDDDIYTIAVAGGKTMSYAKVENAIDYTKGQELVDELRERFLETFRMQ
jgi:hypothetical protein